MLIQPSQAESLVDL